MGKGLSKLNWVTVAVIVAFILSAINTINSFIVKKKPISFCTVDILQISNEIALRASEKNQNQKRENQDNPTDITKDEALTKEVNLYMQAIKERISSPEQYGCNYIAVKGSIFGKDVRDITEQVLKDVK